jgi:hypothetical protein
VVPESLKNMAFKMGNKGSNVIFVKKFLLLKVEKQIRKSGAFSLRASKHIVN